MVSLVIVLWHGSSKPSDVGNVFTSSFLIATEVGLLHSYESCVYEPHVIECAEGARGYVHFVVVKEAVIEWWFLE